MASQHIRILRDGNKPLTAEVRALVDGARDVQQRAVKVKDILDQIAYEGDWTSLGTELGLDATDAQAVYNLVAGIQDEVATSVDYNALIDRLG